MSIKNLPRKGVRYEPDLNKEIKDKAIQEFSDQREGFKKTKQKYQFLDEILESFDKNKSDNVDKHLFMEAVLNY